MLYEYMREQIGTGFNAAFEKIFKSLLIFRKEPIGDAKIRICSIHNAPVRTEI